MKKNLLFLFMLTLFVGFSSCSSDDDQKEPFKWEGDIEGYNPLLGTWIFEKNPSEGLRFSEDKVLYRVTSSGYNILKIGTFEINYKAYKYGNTSIRRYKLDGDRLTQYPNQNDNDNPIILIKVKKKGV